ncbi:hypothetical protein DIU36_16770 [Mucilaginibacter rubeus]|nr:hypothetical protein DIU36_16770 [Mucilaginibacter rubeus]
MENAYSKADLPDTLKRIVTDKKNDGGFEVPCKNGQIGDLIWVREEHNIKLNGNYVQCLFKDLGAVMLPFSEISEKALNNIKKRKTLGKWQRARFLPKEFSRIWLEITDIRIERLKNITEEDSLREGVEMIVSKDILNGLYKNYQKDNSGFLTPVGSFLSVWDVINGDKSHESNPWVWVISFKVLSTNDKPENVDKEAATA